MAYTVVMVMDFQLNPLDEVSMMHPSEAQSGDDSGVHEASQLLLCVGKVREVKCAMAKGWKQR